MTSTASRRDNADRFIHNEVLHTLRMIAMERAVIPAAPVLAAAVTLRRTLAVQHAAPQAATQAAPQQPVALDEHVSSRLEQRLRGSRSHLVAFLDEVLADPELIEQDEGRERADRLERGLRDIIALSVDPALGSAMTGLRMGGWTVRSRWTEDLPRPAQTLIAAALDALPATALPARGLGPTVTVTGTATPEGWRLSLLVRPTRRAWVSSYDPGPLWEVHREDGLHAVAIIA